MRDGDGNSVDEPDRDDAALLERLRALAGRVDPVPSRVEEGARAALTWRTIDAELMELTRDSALDRGGELAQVRSAGSARLLGFDAPDLTIELEITTGPRQRLQLVGQLVPPALAEIVVEHRGGTSRTESDAFGRFMLDDVSPGPARLRCRLLGAEPGREISTEWTQL
jgi:hypothetical protein